MKLTSQTHTLTRHHDIRNWVDEHRGTPAIARMRDRFGGERSELQLHFPRIDEGQHDVGMSPVSWTAWLAELERQQLALRVEPEGGFTLVPRKTLH